MSAVVVIALVSLRTAQCELRTHLVHLTFNLLCVNTISFHNLLTQCEMLLCLEKGAV